MTLQEATDIIHYVTQMWPFQRLTQEELKEVEKAYSVIKQEQMKALGEPPF